MRRLRCYGGTLDGVSRCVVFATSMKRAAEILRSHGRHTSLHYLRGYWSESGNPIELALCDAESVWEAHGDYSQRKYAQWLAAPQTEEKKA